MAKKKYRFFYHYRKQTKRLTLHYKGECIPLDDLVCEVQTESKWNKRQPHIVMQGFAEEVTITNSDKRVKALIQ